MITPSPLHQSLYRAATTSPLLASKDEEYALVARAQAGDADAIDTLTKAYMRLIVSLARKFAPNADPNDLVVEGTLGFMRAIERFDPSKGYRLGTYARSWILERLKEHTRVVRSVVALSGGSDHKRGLYTLGKAIDTEAQHARNAGEHVTRYQLLERAAARCKISVANAQDIQARSGGDVSLNLPVGGEEDEGMQWQDTLVDEGLSPEARLAADAAARTRTALLKDAMQGLNPRERRIIMERRLSDNPTTLEALGEEFGISKERVRQIETRAFEKMAAALQPRREEALQAI